MGCPEARNRRRAELGGYKVAPPRLWIVGKGNQREAKVITSVGSMFRIQDRRRTQEKQRIHRAHGTNGAWCIELEVLRSKATIGLARN